jgi:hypothetical protein
MSLDSSRNSTAGSRRLGAIDSCHTIAIVYDMNRMVQARLDAKTERLLVRLRRQTGANDSEIVRRGIEALSRALPQPSPRSIRGLGQFDSGCSDLGSNKDHLAGFGRS